MLRQAVLALVGAVYTREVSAVHLWRAILNSDSYVYFDYSICSDLKNNDQQTTIRKILNEL